LKANPDNPTYRESFRKNRLFLAATLVALGDHVGAGHTAEQLAALGWDPAFNACNAACILAQCIPTVQGDTTLSELRCQELTRAYTDRALNLLRQSVSKGYRDVTRVKKDKSLDPLRKLPDFDKLVREMEEKEKGAAK
jgi:hypothetical protein